MVGLAVLSGSWCAFFGTVYDTGKSGKSKGFLGKKGGKARAVSPSGSMATGEQNRKTSKTRP